jgi:hypothetical protein
MNNGINGTSVHIKHNATQDLIAEVLVATFSTPTGKKLLHNQHWLSSIILTLNVPR